LTFSLYITNRIIWVYAFAFQIWYNENCYL